MRKIIFILALLCAVVQVAWSQTLLIWDESSVLQKVDLKKKPVVTLFDDKFVVDGEGISLEYGITDVRRFTYEGLKNDIDNAETQPVVRQYDDRIVLCGVKSEDVVSLHMLDGKNVPVKLVPQGSDMVLRLNDLPAGVYLLTVNGRTTKLMKK